MKMDKKISSKRIGMISLKLVKENSFLYEATTKISTIEVDYKKKY